MRNDNTFKLSEISKEMKKDVAFQLVVAMRDTIDIAKKKGYRPTYENSIRLFNDFNPELYKDIIDSLPQRNLSDEARVIIAKAAVLSKEENTTITPLEVLQKDIDGYKVLLSDEKNINEEEYKVLKNKIGSLESIKKSLKPRELTENRILIRDTSKADREDFGAKFLEETDFYVDYSLAEGKYLRIRLLHPDKAEHVTGADLIYEQHDENTKMIRVVFLQYKIWENGVLYFSKIKNLQKQIDRLQNCLCQNKYCEGSSSTTGVDFRFPYCCAFLRPTDKLQEQNAKLVSSGIHIPICNIEKVKDYPGNKIEKNKIHFQSLTHQTFEHLFNRGFIGSRWIKEDDLEAFYKKHKILENDDSVVFYAREIREKEN